MLLLVASKMNMEIMDVNNKCSKVALETGSHPKSIGFTLKSVTPETVEKGG